MTGEPGDVKGCSSKPSTGEVGDAYNDNRHLEPSLIRQRDGDARALGARVASLSKALGKNVFDAWFGEAVFEEGMPVRVIFAKVFQANWVRSHYAAQLERAFGESAEVIAFDELDRRATARSVGSTTVADQTGGKAPWWISVGGQDGGPE